MECFLSFFFYDTPNGKKKVSGGLEKRRQKQVASIKPRWKKKKKTTFLDLFVVVFVELFLVGSLVGKRRGQTSLRSLASLVQARVCADRCSVTSFCAF